MHLICLLLCVPDLYNQKILCIESIENKNEVHFQEQYVIRLGIGSLI